MQLSRFDFIRSVSLSACVQDYCKSNQLISLKLSAACDWPYQSEELINVW